MTKNIMVDDRCESYQSFFDHEWSKEMMILAGNTEYYDAVFNLSVSWRGIANTHVMPWLFVSSIKAVSEGVLNAKEPFGRRWVRVIRERLVMEMDDSLRNMQRKKLQEVLDSLYEKCRTQIDAHPLRHSESEFWNKCFSTSEFQFSLWGSQRVCYAALFFAYEDFVVQCVKIASDDPDVDTRSNGFGKILAKCFGSNVRDNCWGANKIRVAQETRNALVHNGGRETHRLAKMNHDLRLIEGEIQIMAPHTTALFRTLRAAATKLAKAAITAEKSSD